MTAEGQAKSTTVGILGKTMESVKMMGDDSGFGNGAPWFVWSEARAFGLWPVRLVGDPPRVGVTTSPFRLPRSGAPG